MPTQIRNTAAVTNKTVDYTQLLDKQAQAYIDNGYELKSITPTTAEVMYTEKFGFWDLMILIFFPAGILIEIIWALTKKPKSCYFTVLGGKINTSGYTLAQKKKGKPVKRTLCIIWWSVLALLAISTVVLKVQSNSSNPKIPNSTTQSYYARTTEVPNTNNEEDIVSNSKIASSMAQNNSVRATEVPNTNNEEDSDLDDFNDLSDDYSENEFIFPDSSVMLIDAEEIEKLSEEEMRIARNEIYARYGYVFQSEDLNEYFRSKDWYAPRDNNDSIELTDIERTNIALIQHFEDN